jgi:hypothetical protein
MVRMGREGVLPLLPFLMMADLLSLDCRTYT